MLNNNIKYQEQIFIPLKLNLGYLDEISETTELDYRFYDIGNPNIYSYSNDTTKSNIIKDWDSSRNKNHVTIWSVKTLSIVVEAKTSIYRLCRQHEINQELLEKDKNDFINHQIGTIISNIFAEYHKQEYSTDEDKLYYSREVIRKEYPGLLKRFDEQYPDKRDVVNGIEKFLRIGLNNIIGYPDILISSTYKTPYVTSFAYNQLLARGYTKLLGFKEAWEMLTDLYKLRRINILENIS